jgi:hypothetical protein
MDSHIVRLNSGEELLCNIKSSTENLITVTNPYIILPTQDGSIQFMKYMAYAVYDELPIKESDIMWVVVPSIELAAKHSEMAGQIATPTQKIIT